MDEPEQPVVRHTISDSGDGNVTLRLEGELDLSCTEALRASVEPVIPAVTGTLVIDVGDLHFADSSAIALWVGWSQRVPRLEIRDPQPMILRVIQSMGLVRTLNPS
jgi:anti-anti-sigma factor